MLIYSITQIHIYPVKSLSGVSLNSAKVEERGLQYDRRWMLVDESNRFISQRSHPQLTLINVEIKNNLLIFSHKQKNFPPLTIPVTPYECEKINAQVWQDNVPALKYNSKVNNWFMDVTGCKINLVFMPDTTKRIVDPDYAENKIVSFADGYPFMMLGEESLNDLNFRLSEPLPMNRFRPNFVFAGGKPFDEDKWLQIKIGNIHFNVVKSCSRCVITTINQNTGEKGAEPLFTLAKFRNENGKVLFGQNMVAENTGIINVGDKIDIDSSL